MSLIFRYTNPPEQENFLDGFNSTLPEDQNKVSQNLLIPFFGLTSRDKIPNIVTPGGYYGTECFEQSYEGTIVTLEPGFCIINEMLVEIKNKTIIDLSKMKYFIDNYDFTELTGYSGYSEKVGRLYLLVYYDYDEIGVNNYTGYTGRMTLNKNQAYITAITKKSTYTENIHKFCFLYYVRVLYINNRVTSILDIGYSDPDDIDMKRKIPDFQPYV